MCMLCRDIINEMGLDPKSTLYLSVIDRILFFVRDTSPQTCVILICSLQNYCDIILRVDFLIFF